MMNRYEVELLISALTGGSQPNVGDSIVFGLDGWTFGAVSGSAEWVSIDADGAVGDGTEDDTIALQSVLDRAKYVLVPEGKTYSITAKLVYYENQIILGLGSSFKGALSTALMSSDNIGVACPNVVIAGIVLDNTSKATGGGIGLDGTLSELTLINVTTQNVETGFRLQGNAKLTNTKTTDCTTHYDINGGKIQTTAPVLVNAAGTPTGFDISGGSVIIIDPDYTGITTEITDTTGQVIVFSDGKIWASDGSSADPIIAFLDEAGLGLYRKATGQVVFVGTSNPQLLLPSGASTDPSLAFDAEDTLGFYRQAATKLGLKGNFYLDGNFEQVVSTEFGALGATPVVRQAVVELAADGSSDALTGTGIDNAQGGNVYAQVSDHDALVAEYNLLRATVTDLRTKFDEIRDLIVLFGFMDAP